MIYLLNFVFRFVQRIAVFIRHLVALKYAKIVVSADLLLFSLCGGNLFMTRQKKMRVLYLHGFRKTKDL